MHLREVFQTAFLEGCGVQFPNVLRGDDFPPYNFDDAREPIRALKPDSPQTRAYWRGLLRTYREIHGGGAGREVKPNRALRRRRKRELKLTYGVSLLGRMLINEAAVALSDDLAQQAYEWHKLDRDKRFETLKRIKEKYGSPDPENPFARAILAGEHRPLEWVTDPWLRDILLQQDGGVFARVFSDYRKEVKPNCVGRAQMALAFGMFAGARTWAMTPLEREGTEFDRQYARLARTLFLTLSQHGWHIERSILESLLATTLRLTEPSEAPEYFHLGALIEIGPGDYVFIDPMSRVCEPLPATWNVEVAIRTLDEYHSVQPGLTVLIEDGGALKRSVIEIVKSGFAVARIFEKLIGIATDSGDGPRSAALGLARSEALDLIIPLFASGVLDTQKEEIEVALNGGAPVPGVPLTPDLAGRCGCSSERARLSVVLALCLDLWQRVYKRPLPDGARSESGGSSAEAMHGIVDETMPTLVSQLVTAALERGKPANGKMNAAGIPHRRYEISRPEVTLGAAVLSHLAAIRGWACADAVDCALARISSSQFRLHTALTACQRGEEVWRHNSYRAVAPVLRRVPFQLRSVRKALAIIDRRTRSAPVSERK